MYALLLNVIADNYIGDAAAEALVAAATANDKIKSLNLCTVIYAN